MRRLWRALAAAMVALVAVGWSSASAQAVTGDVRWSGYVKTSSSTTASGTVTWNVVSHAVTMTVVTGPLTAGYCVTAYFDWSSNGHHDARALRTCKASDQITYTFKDATPSNIVNRPTKLGLCYGLADKRGSCSRGAGLLVPTMDWTPWPDRTRSVPCDLSWVRRNATGTTSSFIDPHSMSGGLVGSRC